MSQMPSLYVSHGAPNLVLDNTPATRFLKSYSAEIGRPEAIVVASAHFGSGRTLVTADSLPEMIYDFGGFEPELYEIRYPAPGNPGLAGRIAGLLEANGIETGLVNDRGYDHGTWVPLKLMYPDADIPVVQISISPDKGPEHHYRVGSALRPLQEDGVLVVGSGSLTHNLAALFRGNYEKDAQPPEWVETFVAWMHDHVAAGNVEALLGYRRNAPFAVENHPTDEHLLPLFVAAGAAASGGVKGERVHASTTFGVLAMDAYAFH